MNPSQLNLMFDASKTRYDGVAVRSSAKPRKARIKPQAPEVKSPRPVASRLHQELVVPIPRETPSYRRTFRVMLANPDKTDRWDELILRYARIYNLDSRLMKSIMAAESEFDPAAVSPSGARGLMQVMPDTAQGVGVNAAKLNRPASGVKAGAAYLQVLFQTAWKIFHLKGVRYTDAPLWVVQRVVAAYHAGPKFLTRLDLHPTTRSYVRKVVHFYGSKVTDLRRPSGVELDLPVYSRTIASSGSMY